MVIQKLKLHEWFLVYQLDQIKKTANHTTLTLKLDVSEYVKDYRKHNIKIPSTAILVKIIGIWAAANPEVNKMLFRTFKGFYFLKGDEVRINFPIAIDFAGRSAITAIVLRNPHLKSIQQIQNEFKVAKSKPLSAYPITNWVYTNSNHFLNRFFLKLLHALINKFPNFYWKKGGGCISVSSLSNFSQKECLFSAFSLGPTGFTFFFKDLEIVEGKTKLNLSIAVDHNCYSGIEIAALVNELMRTSVLFENKNLGSKSLTQDVHI